MSALVETALAEPEGSEAPLLSAVHLAHPVFRQVRSRRRVERIRVDGKIPGLLAGQPARLIDLSLSGVQVEHQNIVQRGDCLTIAFAWSGDDVTIECEVVRSEFHRFSGSSLRKTYRSGLMFRRYQGESESVLRSMITELVERALDERKANANGVPPMLASYAVSGKIRGYLRLRLIHGTWQRLATGDPIQPVDGFTVSIDEDPAQIELLCETYQKLSNSDRELVRKMAALSVSNPSGLPIRKYEP